MNFYPRPPRGGRLFNRFHSFSRDRISIHALREEGDTTTGKTKHTPINFYPRPPRGGRP